MNFRDAVGERVTAKMEGATLPWEQRSNSTCFSPTTGKTGSTSGNRGPVLPACRAGRCTCEPPGLLRLCHWVLVSRAAHAHSLGGVARTECGDSADEDALSALPTELTRACSTGRAILPPADRHTGRGRRSVTSPAGGSALQEPHSFTLRSSWTCRSAAAG